MQNQIDNHTGKETDLNYINDKSYLLLLLQGRGKDDIGRFQWHIIPLANPDGYEYTRTHDRMWRKNTVNIPGTSCIGVDINRNFPEGYGVGASKNPCSEVYQARTIL